MFRKKVDEKPSFAIDNLPDGVKASYIEDAKVIVRRILQWRTRLTDKEFSRVSEEFMKILTDIGSKLVTASMLGKGEEVLTSFITSEKVPLFYRQMIGVILLEIEHSQKSDDDIADGLLEKLAGEPEGNA